MLHKPVLLAESIKWLDPRAGGWWADLTVGGGGHTTALLAAIGPSGKVLGIDRDEEVLKQTEKKLAKYKKRLRLIKANFTALPDILKAEKITSLSGVIMDIGVSSFQLERAERGFSIKQPGPLDMRMDNKQALTAAEIINHTSEKELADIFYKFGQERRSRQIARLLVRQRPIYHTQELAQLVSRVVRSKAKIHPATRVFQALRIVVNDELNNLQQALLAINCSLKPRGRLVIITFHSLEDRIVKQEFKKTSWKNLTKKVIKPSYLEIRDNPRARSAKLRVAYKLEETG